MQYEAVTPNAVLRATCADGTAVSAVVGDEVPTVRDLPESTVQSFRHVWEMRRDIDFPALARLGRISQETQRRWAGRATSLLAFVDERRTAGLLDYTYPAAKVSVLYSPVHDAAFVVDLEPPGQIAPTAVRTSLG